MCLLRLCQWHGMCVLHSPSDYSVDTTRRKVSPLHMFTVISCLPNASVWSKLLKYRECFAAFISITIPFPDIMSRMLGCRRTVLRLGEHIAIDLADLSKCSMLAWGLKSSSGVFFFISIWTPWIQLHIPWEKEKERKLKRREKLRKWRAGMEGDEKGNRKVKAIRQPVWLHP